MKKVFLLAFLILIGSSLYSQPLPPIPIYPLGDTCVNVQNIHFNWHPSVGATSYRIRVSTGPTYNIDSSGIVDTFFIPPVGIFNTMTYYYWTLKAYGPGGESPWAPYWHFTTCPGIPNPPTLLAPPDSSTVPVNGVVFDWTDVQGVNSYGIQISASPVFSTTVVNILGLTNSAYSIPSGVLSNNIQYYWRVNASNAGGTSPWSSIWRFKTVVAPPPAPAIIYPCGQTNVPLTPTLDWTDVTGATSYRVSISTIPQFDTIVVPSMLTIPPGKLYYNTMYYWRVAAINNGGQSQWSVICNFSTINSIGIKLISSKIPTEYKLFTNYPNPFNPATIIRFQIKDLRLVTLKIYDILGKEVATLVDEKQSPGIYEVSFNGSNLPGGVYFYLIRSGDFTDTKRMILIK